MMLISKLSLLILGLATLVASSSLSDNNLICKVNVVLVNMEDHKMNEDTMYMCETLQEQDPSQRRGMMYSLVFPEGFVDQHPELQEGNVVVSIPRGKVVDSFDHSAPPVIEYDAGAHITIVEPSDRRQLYKLTPSPKKTGVNSVLVIRVTSSDSEMSISSETLSARVFGIGDGAPEANIVSQHNDCSFGKLQMKPAEGPGIVNGVVEMFLPRNTIQDSLWTYENDLIALAEEYRDFDHIMYCLPEHTHVNGESYVALAYNNGRDSYYNDATCGSLSVYMHEIGHNLGLHHSGDRTDGGDEYGDTSSYMGFGVTNGVGSPAMCYNAYNYWYLGWYDETRTVEVNGDRPWTGYLDAFTNYENPSADDSVVAIKVGEYYLQYNRADKFNFETRRSANHITVVKALGEGRTDLEGSMITGSDVNVPVFAISNFRGTGFAMIIEACEHTFESDRFTMSVHLDDGNQVSYCNGGVQPTASPSASPSALPTPGPSSSAAPTLTESSHPTGFPSFSLRPSAIPSVAPSGAPTTSLRPSAQPSDSPSNKPSSSLRPSANPSGSPSGAPSFSQSPSFAPSRYVPREEGSGGPNMVMIVLVLAAGVASFILYLGCFVLNGNKAS